jgi:hypothetical protein
MGSGIAVVAFLQSSFDIPYLGAVDNDLVDNIIQQASVTVFGGSAFPQWLIPQGLWDMIWKAPVRVVYFFFSPLPWEITKPQHFIGFLDGVLYFILLCLLWKRRKFILKNSSAKILLSMLVIYVLVFSLGTVNSGTTMRHRIKMFPIIIVLVAPFLPMVRIRRGNFVGRKDVDPLVVRA